MARANETVDAPAKFFAELMSPCRLAGHTDPGQSLLSWDVFESAMLPVMMQVRAPAPATAKPT
jgi:hypothetical protein